MNGRGLWSKAKNAQQTVSKCQTIWSAWWAREYPPIAPGWRKVTQNQFSHMVLARYPSQSASQLISEEWIHVSISRWMIYLLTNNGEVIAVGR